MANLIKSLKERWGVKNSLQVVVILVVFAATGFSVLGIKEPLYNLAGITQETPLWIRFTFYSLTVLPLYQGILLFWGFVFGQFDFFWNFEKKMFGRIKNLFKQ